MRKPLDKLNKKEICYLLSFALIFIGVVIIMNFISVALNSFFSGVEWDKFINTGAIVTVNFFLAYWVAFREFSFNAEKIEKEFKDAQPVFATSVSRPITKTKSPVEKDIYNLLLKNVSDNPTINVIIGKMIISDIPANSEECFTIVTQDEAIIDSMTDKFDRNDIYFPDNWFYGEHSSSEPQPDVIEITYTDKLGNRCYQKLELLKCPLEAKAISYRLAEGPKIIDDTDIRKEIQKENNQNNT